ncbi:MAG: SDR family oxidoreductase [Calditrichaeota bacterium]|nr:SDR family oxidoreductase [Calditrichota bacterium]
MGNPTHNPVALVTGATTGIGYELSKLLAADGYSLILVARNSNLLQQRQKELEADYGISVQPIALDLARPDAVKVLTDRLKDRLSDIEILINNAGFGKLGAFWETDPETVVDMIQVNVTALVALTRAILPYMLQQGKGSILNVASTAAFSPGPYMAVYYASKAFVVSFSEALADELRGTGVTVTTLCPGPTRTEFQIRAGQDPQKPFPILPMMSAGAVARVAYRSLKRGQRMVIPGLMNRLSVLSSRLMPRRLSSLIIKWIQSRR